MKQTKTKHILYVHSVLNETEHYARNIWKIL